MKILMIASEVAPFVKTGGLGEVMASLPAAIENLGHDVRVFMPLYGTIDANELSSLGSFFSLKIGDRAVEARFRVGTAKSGVPVYFFESDRYFPRGLNIYEENLGNEPYYAFNKSVTELLRALDWQPDVIHGHDWQAALVPEIIGQMPADSPYRSIATMQTIHNTFPAMVDQWQIPAGLQDQPLSPLTDEWSQVKYINFLKRGILRADVVTTVSRGFADELMDQETSHGIFNELSARANDFYAVGNGLDYDAWGPEVDPNVPVEYSRQTLDRRAENKRALQQATGLDIDPTAPLLGMNNRLSEQKGVKLVIEIIGRLVEQGAQLVAVGDGDIGFAEALRQASARHPGRVAYQPYSDAIGSLVYAGLDVFILPSLYEPCGRGQIISLRYGAVPVVRRTGGLADTIIDYDEAAMTGDQGNGYVFDDYTGAALLSAIERALAHWRRDKTSWQRLMQHNMGLAFTWDEPAKQYEQLYRTAISERARKLKLSPKT